MVFKRAHSKGKFVQNRSPITPIPNYDENEMFEVFSKTSACCQGLFMVDYEKNPILGNTGIRVMLLIL
jgi:hypothetical protein